MGPVFGDMKRVIVPSAVFALVLALALSATALAKSVELTIMVYNMAGWLTYHEEAVAEFERANPGVDVIVVPGDPQKLKVSLAGGVPIDLFYYAGGSFTSLAHTGLLADLQPFIDRDPGFDLDEFFPAAVDAHRYRGTLYGLPQTVSPVLFVYNKHLFDRAGTEYPSGSWTWDDIVEKGKKLTVDANADGETDQFAFSYQSYVSDNRWSMYVWQNGADVFSADQSRLILDEPEAIEALNYYRDLGMVHGIAPLLNDPILKNSDYNKIFNEGKAAMIPQTRYYNPPPDIDWGLTLVPKGRERATTLVTNFYSMVDSSSQKEEAWRLLRHLLTVSTRKELLDKAFPAVPAYRSNAIDLIESELDRSPDERLWLEAMESARSPYYPPIASWGAILNKYLVPWGEGKLPTETMVEEMVRETNAQIAELNQPGE